MTVTIKSEVGAQAGPVSSGPGVEVVFRPDPTVYDGRFANNAWLQELPRPVTRLTWDNAVVVSPKTAKDLDLEDEERVAPGVGDERVLAADRLPHHREPARHLSGHGPAEGNERHVLIGGAAVAAEAPHETTRLNRGERRLLERLGDASRSGVYRVAKADALEDAAGGKALDCARISLAGATGASTLA